MDVKDTIDLFIIATDKVEFFWNFYVVSVISLVGWLVTTKRPLTVFLKFLITVGYLLLAAMNLLGLYNTYNFAEALREDLLAMEGQRHFCTRTTSFNHPPSYSSVRRHSRYTWFWG